MPTKDRAMEIFSDCMNQKVDRTICLRSYTPQKIEGWVNPGSEVKAVSATDGQVFMVVSD